MTFILLMGSLGYGNLMPLGSGLNPSRINRTARRIYKRSKITSAEQNLSNIIRLQSKILSKLNVDYNVFDYISKR